MSWINCYGNWDEKPLNIISLPSFSNSILSILTPWYDNSCWEKPDKSFYDILKKQNILSWNDIDKWWEINYNYLPHPEKPGEELLAITFSDSNIVPEIIRGKSLWMSNVYLPEWSTNQKNFHDYVYTSLWDIYSRKSIEIWWKKIKILSHDELLFHELTDNPDFNLLKWFKVNSWEFLNWVEIISRSLINPEILEHEMQKLLSWFSNWWLIPSYEEFAAIWDFLPWSFEEKLLILNIPLNWYSLELKWHWFDVKEAIIKYYFSIYWEDVKNWPTNIQDEKKIIDFKISCPYHYSINNLAMFWTRKPYREKAFCSKTIMVETFVLDKEKLTYNISDIENFAFASMRTFV